MLSAGNPKGKGQFKDYCLILQVHPEADGAMIDAAYWHLAKRYNEAPMSEARRRRKLEELNEAYNVLGSADRKEAYLLQRAAILGEGALPVPPPPEPGKPPLAVMGRQRPRPREPAEEGQVRQYWGPALLSTALAMPVVLGLAIAAFLAGDTLTVAATLAAGLLLASAPLVAAVLRQRPAFPRPSLPSMGVTLSRLTLRRGVRSEEPPASVVPIDTDRLRDAIRSQREKLRDDAADVPQFARLQKKPPPQPEDLADVLDARD